MAREDFEDYDILNRLARWIMILLVSMFGLMIVVFSMQRFGQLRVALSYGLPFVLAFGLVLSVTLLRRSQGDLPIGLLFGGTAFAFGGIALDMAATILKTPTLERESNPIARALLDSGHSVRFVCAYAVVAQSLFGAVICTLWAAFLKQRRVILRSAWASRPPSALAFIKAATGGADLTWRQWIFPIKASEMPRAYFAVWVAAVVLLASCSYRWLLGLAWFSVLPFSYAPIIGVAFVVAGTVGYFAWLWSGYVAGPDGVGSV